MALYHKVTGEFTNGHGYEVLVAEADYQDFLQHYLNSTDDGAFLNESTIQAEEVIIEVMA